jgi:L-tartrate/succinate antiporter
VVCAIPPLDGSLPGESARKIGADLRWAAFPATSLTNSRFLTALAPNLLALEMVRQATGLDVSWVQWFVGFAPIGLALLLAMPWRVLKIYPSAIRGSAEVPPWAAQEWAKIGAVTRREWTMAVLVVVARGRWIFGGRWNDATLVALVAISLRVVGRVVTWDEIGAHPTAWSTFAWVATMLTLAVGLNKTGFIPGFGPRAEALLAGHKRFLVLVALVAFFFVLHDLFASRTAHTTAVLPAVLAAGAAIPGLPGWTRALLLGFSFGRMGLITPSATGTVPVYYGGGYIGRRDFWPLVFVFGLIFLAALLPIGSPTLGASAKAPAGSINRAPAPARS